MCVDGAVSQGHQDEKRKRARQLIILLHTHMQETINCQHSVSSSMFIHSDVVVFIVISPSLLYNVKLITTQLRHTVICF